MAQRDTAGLAALGALALMASRKRGADRDTDTGVDVMPSYATSAGRPSADSDLGAVRAEDGTLSGLRRNTESNDLYSPNEPITRPRPVMRPPVASARPTPPQVAPQQAAPSQAAPVPRMTTAQAMAELDRATGTKQMDPNAVRGPNAVTGTDFSRNISNTLNALTPIGGGVGKVGVDMAYRGRNAATAAEKFREAATTRKAAEGYSPAEALSVLSKGAGKNVKSAGREEVTNPMMWAAGPKNAKNFKEPAKDLNKRSSKQERMSEEGFNPAEALAEIEKRGPKKWQAEGVSEWKRGGKIKKMASGGMARSSASSRGDGIASKGKTRGKMY
jgi:hypothetical protein